MRRMGLLGYITLHGIHLVLVRYQRRPVSRRHATLELQPKAPLEAISFHDDSRRLDQFGINYMSTHVWLVSTFNHYC